MLCLLYLVHTFILLISQSYSMIQMISNCSFCNFVKLSYLLLFYFCKFFPIQGGTWRNTDIDVLSSQDDTYARYTLPTYEYTTLLACQFETASLNLEGNVTYGYQIYAWPHSSDTDLINTIMCHYVQ